MRDAQRKDLKSTRDAAGTVATEGSQTKQFANDSIFIFRDPSARKQKSLDLQALYCLFILSSRAEEYHETLQAQRNFFRRRKNNSIILLKIHRSRCLRQLTQSKLQSSWVQSFRENSLCSFVSSYCWVLCSLEFSASRSNALTL